jgi:hypothetical protein
MRIHHRDDGAALVEFALVSLVLFTILFGIVEFGLAFRDWLSVTSSTREGARVAAAAGNDPDADCAILNAMTGPLLAVPTDSADTFRVFIYKANADGSMSGSFQEFVPDEGAALNPVACNQSWDLVANGYPPASREVTFDNLDTVGVRIEFVHQWVTDLFPFNPNWTDDSIMRMEPKSFSGP